ncbi:MAG: PilZ domain-containing protein [Rhodomicrobiaceae bacterium]
MSRYIIRHRLHEREKVSIKGKLVCIADKSYTLDCMIVDLSPGGARVELDEECMIPDELLLFERDNQNIYECLVRWRNGRQAGLHFIDLCSKAVRQALMDDQTLGLTAEQPDPS